MFTPVHVHQRLPKLLAGAPCSPTGHLGALQTGFTGNKQTKTDKKFTFEHICNGTCRFLRQEQTNLNRHREIYLQSVFQLTLTQRETLGVNIETPERRTPSGSPA